MENLLERYQSFFENFDNGVLITEIIGDGHDFLIKDLNRVPQIFLGDKKEELIDKKISEVLPFEKQIGIISKMREVYYKEEKQEYFFSFYKNDELEKNMDFNIIKLKNGEIAVNYRDLTEKKKRRHRLIKKRNRLALAVEGADLGIWDWNISKDKFEFNHKWKKLLGYNRTELENKIDSWTNIVHENDRKKVLTKIKNHLQGKTDIYEVEARLETKSNDYKWIKAIGKIVERKNNMKPKRVAGVLLDIDDRKRMERKLKEQKAYFDQLFEESTEAIILLENDGSILKVSNHFEKLFGYKEEEILSKKIDDLILPEDRIEKGYNYTEKVADGGDVKIETIRKKKNGEKIHVSLHAFPITLKGGQLGIYTIYNDISQRKEEEEKIKYLSFHDQLTDLYNRRYFENEMERLSDSRMKPVSILVIDIDGLKEINDNYGHKRGDEYIKTTAEIISSAVRKEDIAARIGGDEFAIILPYTTKEAAQKMVNRINEICQKYTEELDLDLEISAGCATCHRGDDLGKIFVRADKDMYYKKKTKI